MKQKKCQADQKEEKMKLYLVALKIDNNKVIRFEILGLFKEYNRAVECRDRLRSAERFPYDKQFYSIYEIESDL